MKNYLTKKEWEEATGRRAPEICYWSEVQPGRHYDKRYEANPFLPTEVLKEIIKHQVKAVYEFTGGRIGSSRAKA